MLSLAQEAMPIILNINRKFEKFGDLSQFVESVKRENLGIAEIVSPIWNKEQGWLDASVKLYFTDGSILDVDVDNVYEIK